MGRRLARPHAAGSGLVFVFVIVVSACGSPTITDEREGVLRQPAAWPPHAAPDAGIAAVRDDCAGAGPLPVVVTDDRGFGMVFVLMGTPETFTSCQLRREADGSLVTMSGSSGRDAAPVPADSFVVRTFGFGPPWTPERASADPQIEYRFLDGIAPLGTAKVRAVVGSEAIDATLQDRMFVVAWPNDIPATVLVAIDAAGEEIGRLDASELDPGNSFPSFSD
jgi:hypothetical protein